MTDDYYAQATYYNPYRSRRDQMYYPLYSQYDDYGALKPLFDQLVTAAAYNSSIRDSDKETESDYDIVGAAEAKIKATAEYEKFKAKFDEARKTLEESKAKMQAATKKLEKVTRKIEQRRYPVMYW